MKIKTILMSMLAVAALASCSKDESSATGLNGDARSLKIAFSQQPKSRAIQAPGVADDAAKVTSATIYFYNAAGEAAKYDGTNTSLELTATQIAEAQTTAGYIIEKVDASVTKIAIKANGAENTAATKAIKDYQVDDFQTIAELEGSADVTYTAGDMNVDGHKLYKAAVTLYPALARIEVSGGINVTTSYELGDLLKDAQGKQLYEHKYNATKAAEEGVAYYNSTLATNDAALDEDGYTPVEAKKHLQNGYYSVEVVGIYTNNIYLTYGATTHPWNQKDSNPKWVDAYKAGGSHDSMYNELDAAEQSLKGAAVAAGTGSWWMEQTIPADRNKVILDGKCDAYQIFPQLSTAAVTDKSGLAYDLPHVIVALKVKKTAASNEETLYLNIRNFKLNDARIQSFDAGKIYKFSLNDLVDQFNNVQLEIQPDGTVIVPDPEKPEPPVTPEPDPDTIFDLQVNVTVADWTVVNVTPEI